MIRFLALLLFSTPAFAAPPPGTDMDSPIARWFQVLKQPETGYLCCSIADCRPVAYRTVGNHFQAFIDRKSFGPRAPDDWRDVRLVRFARGCSAIGRTPCRYRHGGSAHDAIGRSPARCGSDTIGASIPKILARARPRHIPQ